MPVQEFTITSNSEGETGCIAAAIARFLRPGDALMLKGGLAGGKTTFVKALVRATGSDADVTSPTFTLAHFYKTPIGTVLHVDAYRLSSLAEFRDLGLDEYIGDCITAVEWGDRVERDFPEHLSIDFESVASVDTTRKVTIGGLGHRWIAMLDDLQQQVKKCVE
ncbi:MAG: tRNA (adenosine(37)-N6)-threonylcarbamoyltransferase complex ATPase subunit type 1 TsaE [Acidobacteriaceae bacterium]|nr:tRNA (adenosine(37)-N6)-threonylcarbamoyltransferase complex ATPase subunit type 1 TsaE [Acidobacteriaceae bacterium]